MKSKTLKQHFPDHTVTIVIPKVTSGIKAGQRHSAKKKKLKHKPPGTTFHKFYDILQVQLKNATQRECNEIYTSN